MMKRNSIAIPALVIGSLLALGCAEGTIDDAIGDIDTIQKIDERDTEEIVNNLIDVGFPQNDIEVRDDGSVLVGGDAFVTLEASREMLGVDREGDVLKQYRTTNLVSSPRTISVIGYTGGSQALDSTMRTGLQWAINNYNRLNIGLTFTLTFGTNYQAFDIVVYRGGSGAGGSAGFPSGGEPYGFVEILSGTSSYGTNVVEHVMTHEIGHAIGFRHTDYFNRSISCGSGGNEGDGGVGAIHIPGTSTGADMNSIMLSCFSSSENGEFGSGDITALEYLY